MSRTKGSKNIKQDTTITPATAPITSADETLKVPEKPKENSMLFNMEQVQDMVNAAVAKALDGGANSHIDDTGYWQAITQCQSDIFGCIPADQVIRLSEEHEKTLKLGKFAETKIDKKTGKTVIVTYAHLKKPSQYLLRQITEMGEEKAVDEGLCIMPSMNQSQSLDEKKPFRLKSAA